MLFSPAPDIKSEVIRILGSLPFDHIANDRLFCFRSQGSKSRAIARIWSLPHIWQLAVGIPASYCIEVISERFDRLSQTDKEKVLIHELMHIPKTFSGALLPHKGRYHRIDRRTVDQIYRIFQHATS